MTRRILPLKVLDQERAWITQFALNHVISNAGSKVPIADIYNEYCDFLARKNLGPSKLTVDGFGRMFPKGFKRGAGSVNGKCSKCVFDIQVVR